jgi:hypothetical protein
MEQDNLVLLGQCITLGCVVFNPLASKSESGLGSGTVQRNRFVQHKHDFVAQRGTLAEQRKKKHHQKQQ